MYRIGDKFIDKDNGGFFILACIDGTIETATISLISLEDGNRWTAPVTIKMKNSIISKTDWDLITNNCAGRFQLIK